MTNFCGTLELLLIMKSTFCEIGPKCVVANRAGANIQSEEFTKTDTDVYVPEVTLSNQDKTKLLQKLKSRFKWTTNWNKYLLNIFIPFKNKVRTYQIIIKVATGQGGKFTTSCLLDYMYFKENFTLIAIEIHLSKLQVLDANTISLSRHEQVCLMRLHFKRYFSHQKYLSKRSLIKHTCSWRDKLIALWTLNRQVKIFLRILDANPKAIQQINFAGNLNRARNAICILQEVKEHTVYFSQGTVRVFWFSFFHNCKLIFSLI